MQIISVPTINNNDTDALLVAWSKADGEAVKTGETIAILETTKASFELAAEADGFLQITAPIGRRYDFGATLGRLLASESERTSAAPVESARVESKDAGFVLTEPARALVAKHGINEEQLRALGRKVIKAKDLAGLVPTKTAVSGSVTIPLRQQGIARVVSHSHATIPASFVVKKVSVELALATLGQFSREQKVMAGLADLLVWIVARESGEFPFFFGALHDDLTFSPSTEGNVGVTFDLGQGLFIPAVRKAGSMSLKEIARTLMSLRMKALRGSFTAEELAPGDLTLSINLDADTVLVQPIILPPQSAMVSIGGVLTELVLNAEGQPVNRRYVHLGCAFDHRVINGAQAAAFLTAIKEGVEAPARGEWG